MSDAALIERLDRYLDAVPRPATRPESIGGLVLFVPATPAGWRYYARPLPGGPPPTVADVARTRERQRELGLPEDFEWVEEASPGMSAAVEGAGLGVVLRPLMVLDHPSGLAATRGDVRIAGPDDDLATLTAVQEVGFRHAGTASGDAGSAALEEAAARQQPGALEFLRGRLRDGLTVYASASADGIPVAVGAHQPAGGVTEIVGVATLPAYRRRGLGAALTAALVADALARGVSTVFLSAADDDVARMYASVGFRRVGSVGAALRP